MRAIGVRRYGRMEQGEWSKWGLGQLGVQVPASYVSLWTTRQDMGRHVLSCGYIPACGIDNSPCSLQVMLVALLLDQLLSDDIASSKQHLHVSSLPSLNVILIHCGHRPADPQTRVFQTR